MKTSWIVRGGLVGLSGLILYLIARADKKAAEKQEAYWKKQDEEIKQMEEQFKEDMKTMRYYQKPVMEIIILQPSSMLAASVTGADLIIETFDNSSMVILGREADITFDDSTSDFLDGDFDDSFDID